MLKTISAALLAVSVLAAPAMAATRTSHAPAARTVHVKHSVLNANAKMGRHHTRHTKHYSHRHHKKMAVHKVGPKVGFKAPAHTTKRG